MPKKLDIEYVREIFAKNNYELISTEYSNNNTKLECKCLKCNNIHSIVFRSLKKARGCPYCANNARHNLEFIKSEFSKNGYELLSEKYINTQTKLGYRCISCGHIGKMSWNEFQQGRTCVCKNEWQRPTIELIKQEFSKKDYILLSEVYINNSIKLKYFCKKCNDSREIAWGDFKQGKGCWTCYIKRNSGSGNYNYKGGVTKLKLPLYETKSKLLIPYENTHKVTQDGFELLGVNCTYCNKIFVPTLGAIKGRIKAIISINSGEARFYCSEGCKEACPTFSKHLWPEGYAPATSREMQPQYRKMVLERDNWTCQKCGFTDTELHAHHIDPVINNPIESCDVDNGITLCKECHVQVHQIPGCSYKELSCHN